MRFSSSLGLVRWIYPHYRLDIHSETQTQYRLLQIPLSYPTAQVSGCQDSVAIWVALEANGTEFKFWSENQIWNAGISS